MSRIAFNHTSERLQSLAGAKLIKTTQTNFDNDKQLLINFLAYTQ